MKNLWFVCFLLIGLIWMGCASPRAVETAEMATADAAPAAEAEAATEAVTEEIVEATGAEAAALASSITVDAKTGEISGKASIAILRPVGDEVAFTKEKQGLDALIKSINNNTQIECSLHGIVSHTELATLQAPLLVVAPDAGTKEAAVLEALGSYVHRGGMVLIDGSWQGNIIAGGTRITPRSSHVIMTDPHNLGSARQTRFRGIDAIQVGERLGMVVTNQSYASFWSGSGGAEQTWATRLGINVLVYALKTSDFSKMEETGQPGAAPKRGGIMPGDLPPI